MHLNINSYASINEMNLHNSKREDKIFLKIYIRNKEMICNENFPTRWLFFAYKFHFKRSSFKSIPFISDLYQSIYMIWNEIGTL